MPIVTVNGTEIEVDQGTSLLRAAAIAGHDVPHFCYHPALSSPANCRMCLVEVEGAPKLLPGCYNSVTDGMVIETESERVVRARKAVLEFILVNHPVDCPICDKAGECKLQDYYFAYDAQESRMRAEKQRKVKAFPIGPRIVYDGERCILCTRCIRFCEEITETAELTLVDRGDKIEVRAFPGRELDNDYSLCTVDLCPVGALTSRDFRFKCRVWLMTSTESICTGCATGCNIHLDHFRNETQRYRPRYNPEVNDYWMCDEGRATYLRLIEGREVTPRVRGAKASWHAIIEHAGAKLSKQIEESGPGSIAIVVSPQSSCEALWVTKQLWELALDAKAALFVGGLAEGRSDDLLLHADKNPNRRGIEAVFGSSAPMRPASELADQIKAGTIRALYMIGSELPLAREAELDLVEAASGLDFFVLQTAHQTPLAERAHLVLPQCVHAEEEGTFVNAHGIAQPYYQAHPPHGAARPGWEIGARIAKALGIDLRFTFLGQIQEKMFEAIAEPEASAVAEPSAPPTS